MRLREQIRQRGLPLGDLGEQLLGDLVEKVVGVVRGHPEHGADGTLLQLPGDEREEFLAVGEPFETGVELLAGARAALRRGRSRGPLLGQLAEQGASPRL